jgi:anti-anti-sigma factor
MGNTLQVERLGNVKGQSVLCFRGPLTVESVSLFQNAIRREEGFSTVILDLSGVPYIDSTALGALVAANVSCQKAGRRSAFWCQRASIENAQDHQRRIAFPHVPDARRCNRRSHAGWHSLVKKAMLAPHSTLLSGIFFNSTEHVVNSREVRRAVLSPSPNDLGTREAVVLRRRTAGLRHSN